MDSREKNLMSGLAVLEAVERKMEALEAAERTADTMCGRALRAEREVVDLEAKMRTLESTGPLMIPALTEALMQVADMTTILIEDS